MSNELYYHSFLNRDRLVFIVDADPNTCEALSVLFRLEGFQTATDQSVEGIYSAFQRRRPDVAVIDLDLEHEAGLAALAHIKALRVGTPVFMLTGQSDIARTVSVMKAGAHDVITKPIDTEKFVRSVRDALRRDVHLGAVQGGRRPIEIRGFNQLTPREREVLQLISNGQSNKEAGRELGISPRTVEVHRARVMEKLGARNTADLMRIILTG